MQLKTILNRVLKFKSFQYGDITWHIEGAELALDVQMKARSNGKAFCGECGLSAPLFDLQKVRRFQFVPLWGILVYFVYRPRRVNCPVHGPRVEQMPWSDGKCHLTTTYKWYLAGWAKRLSWTEVATVFKTSWDSVRRSVEAAVAWGLLHRNLEGIKAIGIDEVQLVKGKFYTVVYQIDNGCKRLLWMGKERTEAALQTFFGFLGQARTQALEFICTDMWLPYLNVIAQRANQALHVLDKFHIAKIMNLALDKVRSTETKELKDKGLNPVLTHSRWCLVKRPENLTEKQSVKLADLLTYNIKSVRAYILKEDFQWFWNYTYVECARKFLREWCTKAMRSKIEPFKKVAQTLRSHQDLLLNYFKAKDQISLGSVEGLNNKLKVVSKKAYGFRTYNVAETMLFHTLGDLPQLEMTHRFC